jgi:carbon storage regulator
VLVLTRRTGDSIVIGHRIVVTVLDVRGDQVRIGIDAPREVQVHREEVYRQLVAENAAAVASVERVDALRARLRRRSAAGAAGEGHDAVGAPDPAGSRPHRTPPRGPRAEGGAASPPSG